MKQKKEVLILKKSFLQKEQITLMSTLKIKIADILLDTYPYASHSTIYDYFKAYLPAVIRQGNSFPSRVASSIYSSVGLSELVFKKSNLYEKIALI